MRQLKLPNGSYVHPGEVDRLQVEKPFWRKKYFVQIWLHDGRSIHLCAGLSEPEAREVRRRYEQQLETFTAGISAYKEGRANRAYGGEKIGYAKGHRDGYREGCAAASRETQDQAFRTSIDAVFEELRLRQFEFIDETRYQVHLVEARKQSLIAMNDLIESIAVMFTRPPDEQIDAEFM